METVVRVFRLFYLLSIRLAIHKAIYLYSFLSFHLQLQFISPPKVPFSLFLVPFHFLAPVSQSVPSIEPGHLLQQKSNPFSPFQIPLSPGPAPSQAVLIFWQAVSERCLSARGRLSMTAPKPRPPISTVKYSKVPNKHQKVLLSSTQNYPMRTNNYIQVLNRTKVYRKTSIVADKYQNVSASAQMYKGI